MMDLFDTPAEVYEPQGWAVFPSGRWCKTRLCGGGHIAMHAFFSGEWAITRSPNGTLNRELYPILYRSADHGTGGTDLHEAMQLAEAKGEEIFEAENPLNRK